MKWGERGVEPAQAQENKREKKSPAPGTQPPTPGQNKTTTKAQKKGIKGQEKKAGGTKKKAQKGKSPRGAKGATKESRL